MFFHATGVVNLARRSRPRGRTPQVPLTAREVRGALAGGQATDWRGLCAYFGFRDKRDHHRLRRLLRGLEHLGEVVRTPNGGYALDPGATNEIEEVIEADGGLVLRGSGEALPQDAGVRPGDRVEVRAGIAGLEVVRVVEPSPEPVVGCLVDGYRTRFVESVDPRIRGRIDIEGDDYAASDGDIVEIVPLWEERRRRAGRGRLVGRIVSVLEARNEADRAARALLASFRVPTEWPEGLDLGGPEAVTAADSAGRVDLTALPLVTIDGPDARDFDDAVYAERRPRGGWRLVVAIADVAHYVRPGAPLDREARRRGNSVYLPDRVVPMLPEALSNGICSLVPGERRLALVCDMQVSAAGRVSRYRFDEAVIESHARLTYDEVAREPAARSALFEVYRALRRCREERGALDFDARESRLVLEDGRVRQVVPEERNDAHRVIEEAMIAANVCAARHLERLGPVYRVHEPPQSQKREQLAEALALGGVRLPADRTSTAALQAAMEAARRNARVPAWIVEALVLRSLSQARYDTVNRGHFGLALPKYLHFTSPIRRYADLVTHRMIKSGAGQDADWLGETASAVSVTERRADDVGRGVEEWLKCAFIVDRVGERFQGTVTGVTEFGLFVELEGLFLRGLVHVSNLGRDWYRFVPETMSLVAERSGERYTLGDELLVELAEVSVETRRVDLVPVRRERRRSRQRESLRG